MKRTLLSLFSLLLFTAALSAQTKYFKGNWTKVGTGYVFEFELELEFTGGNQVKGVFLWTIVQYDENDGWGKDYYQDKLGTTAKEYVRGTYNPGARQYLLKGYEKDDPDFIIDMDEYRINEDENGDIGGDTRSHGSWLGRINGKAVRPDQAAIPNRHSDRLLSENLRNIHQTRTQIGSARIIIFLRSDSTKIALPWSADSIVCLKPAACSIP